MKNEKEQGPVEEMTRAQLEEFVRQTLQLKTDYEMMGERAGLNDGARQAFKCAAISIGQIPETARNVK